MEEQKHIYKRNDDIRNMGNYMMLGFFFAGFICFIFGIHIYLRSEDTQWHKTVDMIQTLHNMQRRDKYSTDNTLQTVISTVDRIRQDHTREVEELRSKHEAESMNLSAKVVSMTSHLEHLRKENHKMQILLESFAQVKKSEMEVLKSQADMAIDKIRLGDFNVKKTKPTKRNKHIKVRSTRATQ